MEFRSKRGNFACFMVIFIIALLVLQAKPISITRKYDISKGYYVFSSSIPFEENKNMVCTIYGSVGVNYELRLIIGEHDCRLYSSENYKVKINGNTFNSFTFNTGNEGCLGLRIVPEEKLSIKVVFSTAIPHYIFNFGIWMFGILFVLTFLINKIDFEKIKRKRKMKRNKDLENNHKLKDFTDTKVGLITKNGIKKPIKKKSETPEVKSKKPIIQSDNKKSNDSFDFGFEFLSNEEIHSQFDSFHLKTSNKYNLIKELATWINKQAEQNGKYGLYPDIYNKTKEFVQLFGGKKNGRI